MVTVIDAGHGGSGRTGDAGAIGPCGAQEKDVVLAISKKLHELLPGSVLTRDDDTYVSLSRRAIIANERGADLFVSVHANAHRNPAAEGIETFHHPDSAEGGKLAACVQQAMTEAFPDHKNRGVKTAPFQVLRQTRMPAILVETEFISGKWCHWLTKDHVQQKYAEAIARGIRTYLKDPAIQAESEDVYRVTVDGEQLGAFRSPVAAVESSLEKRPKRIEIDRLTT